MDGIIIEYQFTVFNFLGILIERPMGIILQRYEFGKVGKVNLYKTIKKTSQGRVS